MNAPFSNQDRRAEIREDLRAGEITRDQAENRRARARNQFEERSENITCDPGGLRCRPNN